MAWHSAGSSEPAIAAANGLALAVYPQGYIDDHYTYLYWNTASSTSNAWSLEPTLMYPHATSTARPTLVAFNGYFYVFYASGVDQYYARFNPQTRTWTGSSLLPFISLGAVAAIPYNGALALVRTEPSNHQLYLRWMASDESFSSEQPITYNTMASDPCQQIVVIGGGLSTAAQTTAPRGDAIVIGLWFNEFASSTPSLAVAGNCLYLAHRDDTSNTLVYNTYMNGSWGPKRIVTSGAGGAAQTSFAQPAIAAYNGGLQMVHIGPSSNYGDIFWSTYSNGTWSAPLSIPNHQSVGTPSLAQLGTRLFMLHLGVSVPEPGGSTDLWSSSYLPH
jgi:hypothetical protein